MFMSRVSKLIVYTRNCFKVYFVEYNRNTVFVQ